MNNPSNLLIALGIGILASVIAAIGLFVVGFPSPSSSAPGVSNSGALGSTAYSSPTPVSQTLAVTTISTPRLTQPPTASPQPTPYAADWSVGLNGWTGNPDWHAVGGQLLNDGTGYESGGDPTIIAPFVPPSPDYTVQADMQAVAATDQSFFSGQISFGIVVRDGYRVGYCQGIGLYTCSTDQENLVISNSRPDNPIVHVPFHPSKEWHTYRVDVRANTISLFVDGAKVLETSDNRYLTTGRIGFWSDRTQITVRNVTITPS